MRKNSCSEEEKKLLFEIFEHNTKIFIIEKFSDFNRSPQSIFRFAKQLGLKRDPKIIKQEILSGGKSGSKFNEAIWAENEDNILRQFYFCSLQETIEEKLPGRTFRAIRERALHLGLSRDKKIIDQDREIKNKKTIMRKYGTDCSLKIPEIEIKSQQTNIKRRGVLYPTQSAEVREKVKETVQKLYGVDNIFQSEAIKEKIIQTNIEKFGVASPQQNKDIQEKTKITNIKKYGFDNPSKSPIIKNKIRELSLSKEIKDKKYNTFKKNQSFSKSKGELNFLNYLRIIDPQTEHHKKHIIGHVIDYYMPVYDLWIQYDGIYWHGKIKSKNENMRSKRIEGVIKNDIYQNENIPNLIRFWSDEIDSAIKNNSVINYIKEKIDNKLKIRSHTGC